MELKRIFGCIALASVCALISSCSLTPGGERDTLDSPWKKKAVQQVDSSSDRQTTADITPSGISPSTDRFKDQSRTTEIEEGPSQELYQGTGNMVNLGVASREALEPGEGDITLNFQDAEIGEVVKTILGDILQKNYVLDEDVRGTVYLQTSRPLSSDELIPTLETLLQFNDAVLLKSQNFYEIVPVDKAPAGAFVPRTRLRAGSGYQVLILPLRYIASSEMMKILEPLKPEKGLIEVDERRNLLTVAGTEEELINIRETVRIFDVDQLKGMSVGLFRLQSVEASVIVEELEAIFGDSAEGPLAGLVRFMPIERLNALLVMTPQKKYLTDVKVWISRLDRAEDRRGMNMYVYYVQNGKAENLAEMLAELFEGQRRSQRRQDTDDEPARPQITRNETAEGDGADSSTDAGTSSRTKVTAAGGDGSSLDVGDVSIIADEENNALLILSSPIDYEKVRDAIEKLDVLPLQVLVEAT
ncbi:secretin N-terminal domain-containing protein, partial [Pontibacterium sp.]|uniref:secretin N-terminal domain-containing protein n=1 Tax=Pontibacterium sp. TaxID=2036026 RepID=UPI00351862CE